MLLQDSVCIPLMAIKINSVICDAQESNLVQRVA